MKNVTLFKMEDVEVGVSHEYITSPVSVRDDILSIHAYLFEPDTLTRISVRMREHEHIIYFFWVQDSSALGFNVLYVPETQVLFLGADKTSVILKLTSKIEILRENTVDLFWSFKYCRNYILELGELECFLYEKTGEIIGIVPVDPPYDIIENEESLTFVSDVMGTCSIKWPDQ